MWKKSQLPTSAVSLPGANEEVAEIGGKREDLITTAPRAICFYYKAQPRPPTNKRNFTKTETLSLKRRAVERISKR